MTTADTTLGTGLAPPAELRLLGRQTAGSLLRNIVRTYRQHFGVLAAACMLPVLPGLALVGALVATDSPLFLAGIIVYTVGAFVSGGAMTIVISDICLGRRPALARAYGRILRGGRWWQLLLTGLLLTLFMYVGLLLLVLPGMWVLARGFLTSTVVALEGRKGMDAIRRSFALTRDQAWRIVGLTLLPLLLAYVAMLLLALVVMFGGVLVFEPKTLAWIMLVLQFGMSILVFTPAMAVTMVLLYYDQRVRREAYDVQALSEDLMR